MLSFKVGLFIHFIQSWTQREFVYLVCLGIKINKSVNEDLSLLTEMSNPKLHSAPLIKYLCGEEGAQAKAETLDQPVNICYNYHLWSWPFSDKQMNETVDTSSWDEFPSQGVRAQRGKTPLVFVLFVFL